MNPLFTCFGSANEGVPLNPSGCFLLSDHAGFVRVHRKSLRLRLQRFGIGNFPQKRLWLRRPTRTRMWTQSAPTVDGQMQVSSARDVAMTPPQCPTTEAGTEHLYFQKEFFHNGYIKSLKQLVHFYNTRDKYCVPCHFRTLPARDDRKSNLLADARGQEQYRHDHRQSRPDG